MTGNKREKYRITSFTYYNLAFRKLELKIKDLK